ncbi:DEP domain-containing mTOR-interacting protein [Varanus komodoensis]|nr:DEP domain-containing mTOR-interacting protein [Varanus komodoensis]
MLSNRAKLREPRFHLDARKAWCHLVLRLRLHEEKIIKDRRHHLKTYPNCFVAKELIDWLIDHKEALDRETAIKLVQKLLDRSIIHHVCDEHKEFKDLKLFYRFRKDDGTFPLDSEVKAFMRGQRIYEKLMTTENVLLQAREEEGIKYERTFMASQMIDWLIQEGEATTRSEAEQLGRRLLEHGIIQHGEAFALLLTDIVDDCDEVTLLTLLGVQVFLNKKEEPGICSVARKPHTGEESHTPSCPSPPATVTLPVTEGSIAAIKTGCN